MNEGIQKEFEMLGKYGCGFLCLCHFFKVPESEVLFYFRLAKKKGIVDTDCFVNDWGKLASLMADEWESFRCEKSNLKDKKAVFCMEYWYNPRTPLMPFLKEPSRCATCLVWERSEVKNTRREGHHHPQPSWSPLQGLEVKGSKQPAPAAFTKACVHLCPHIDLESSFRSSSQLEGTVHASQCGQCSMNG